MSFLRSLFSCIKNMVISCKALKDSMRPSTGLLILLLVFSLLFSSLAVTVLAKRHGQAEKFRMLQEVVFHLGLSDLSLSTEARYTRHPVASDPIVVSMDHPGAIDHFPSTFFWAPVR